ncbi:MAG: sulfatase-like hydrolase/transferase [Planctomycetes bacterium]|nr:sulfatase-like hydrolase/transferase [Planctomycetota bacterium]
MGQEAGGAGAAGSGAPTVGASLRRFALINWLLTLAILSRNFSEVHWLGPGTVTFVAAAWLEYSALYLLPTFGVAFLAAAACRKAGRALAWLPLGVAALLATASQLLLFVDTIVFRMYGFHLNGFVWNLLRTPGGIASMDADGATTRFATVVVAAIVVVEAIAMVLARGAPGLWARLAPRRPRRAAWLAFAAFVILGAGERIAFSFANLLDYRPIVIAHDTFPLYARTRIRKLAERLGFSMRKEDEIEMGLRTGNLRYPLAPLSMAPDRPRWNLVWLVAESWRADTLDPEVMPATDAFAAGSLRFRQHVSGGNGTRMGIFALFYGLYGSYWFPFLAEGKGPVLIDQLLADGYQFTVSTSAKFSFPEFDKTVWAKLPREQLVEGDESKRGWENDRALVTRMLEKIDQRDPSRPFFAFHFFESPHAQYWFPPESVIREPYAERMNYALLTAADMPLVKNRYLNAVHHLDSQLARVFDGLRERGLLDRTIVLVTGDHGEEFMEKGRYGHHSTFSEEQIRTPLLLRIPGQEPRAIDADSSHLDVVPTILRLLGATSDPASYSLGTDLLGDRQREHVVVADWDHLCLRDHDRKGIFPVQQRGFLGFEVTTRDDDPVDDHAGYRASRMPRLLEVMEGLSRFSR